MSIPVRKRSYTSFLTTRIAVLDILCRDPMLIMLCRGLMWPPKEQITSDGYDLQFGTNVIGHFYFTELLMPALLAGKETSLDGHARVVTTSSSGAYFHTLKWDTFVDGPARLQMSTQDLYYQSKFVRRHNIPGLQ